MNEIKIAKKNIHVNIQGYLNNYDDWSEEFARKMAKIDNVKLYNDH